MEDEIDKIKDRAEKIKDDIGVEDKKLQGLIDESNQKKTAMQKNLLIVHAENKADRERIENLSDEEVFTEYAQAFSSGNK